MSAEENTGAETRTEENKLKTAAEKEMDQVYSELHVLRDRVKELEGMLAEKDEALSKVNAHITNRTKGKLLAHVQTFSKYPMEYLAELNVDELKMMIEDRKYYKITTFESSGRVGGVDLDPYVKLHSMFDEAQKRRKEKKRR